MRDIVFLVDDITDSGELITVTDRLKNISENFQENLFDKNKFYYKAFSGKRVQFARLADAMAGSLDRSKRYLYFIPIEDWKCHMQLYFNIISREAQAWFAENEVGIYFAQDFEMYPNLDVNFFGNYLSWMLLCESAHSSPAIPVYFAMCSDIVPKHLIPLREAFGPRIKYVLSPLLGIFSREELASKHGTIDVTSIIRSYYETPKQKSYMALTRDPKYHRLTMMHGLRAHSLLSDGYVSNLVPAKYDGSHVRSNSNYASHVIRDMPPNAETMPFMTVDPVRSDITPGIFHGLGGELPFDHMSRSCYDLVQETATNYGGGPLVLDMTVLTEKVFKSLMLGRPFMVNGGQFILKTLRRWGFNTFPMLFDESYDEPEDFIDRQEIIAKTVHHWFRKYSEFMRVASSQEVVSILESNARRIQQFPFEELLIAEIDRAEKNSLLTSNNVII
jgi:hypothetical protein